MDGNGLECYSPTALSDIDLSLKASRQSAHGNAFVAKAHFHVLEAVGRVSQMAACCWSVGNSDSGNIYTWAI